MNRIEALNILGLDDDATDRDIKVAYKECVQILHPDRFAGNAKLQDRATEQFKRLQDAYDYLSSGRGSKSSPGSSRSGSAPPPISRRRSLRVWRLHERSLWRSAMPFTTSAATPSS